MQKTLNRLLSFLLSVMMLVTMLPVSAFAAEPENDQQFLDSGTEPKHWLQLYQEYALSQINQAASGSRKARAAAGSASPSFSIISWAGGTENRLTFANGAYLGDGMPKITLNGKVAFCAEWNGVAPEGDYIQDGTGSDPVIKQILANYDNSGKSNADYAAAQAAIWAHLMGTTVASWGACPGRSSEDEIFHGTADYTNVKYNYLTWSGGTQRLLTYDNDDEPFVPPDEGDGSYRVEVNAETRTETEVRNRKTYSYSDALGQITIRKHDQDEKSLDGALFDIDVAFSDGSHTTVNGWEVDNGARLFTWTHPQDNHDPATVTVREVQAPNGYIMDPRPQTAVVAPTYTRVTHVETWTVTIVTETTSSTVIDIETDEVVAESSSSSSAETESDPQVEEFTDFIEGDRETTMTFVNTAMPCSLTIYKYETGNKGIALEGASFRIRYADPNVSAQTWTETTDSEGKIYIPLPYAGSLIVEELSAPAGYVMTNKTTYDVTVAKGEQKILEIPNDKKAQLIVTKRDAQSGQVLAGATIKATLLRANTPPFEAGQSFTEVTGVDGKAVFSNLVPGEYRVEEVSPPQYYQGTSEVHTVNIPEGNSETVTLEFRNEPWTGLTIKKVDATDGHGLQNAVFKLYEGTAAENTKYLGDFQTNENGIVVVQKLESGKYYTIVESQPPYGYFLDAEHDTQTILIKPDALDGNLTVVFRNMPKPKLLIEKVDAETGIRLPGATFRVARRGSSEYLDVTTGADGTVLLENLEQDWYEVSELRAPTGYTPDDAHYDIELIPGKTAELTVKNGKKPGLLIEKIDADSGARLPGAVFRVARRGSTEYVDVTTGSNGTVLVENLEPDHYEVFELRAPTGYVADDTHYDVEMIAGKTTELTVKNSKKPGLLIEKIDADTGVRLPGAVFRVTNRTSGESVDITTGTNGTVLASELEPGWYEVFELRAPTGYVADDTHYDVEMIAGKTTELTVKNGKKPGLLIEKIDADTGVRLPGAVFRVTNRASGEFVDITTESNGTVLASDLEPGWYEVYELRAPTGYTTDDTHYDVELTAGKTAELTIKNRKKPTLTIEKIDSMTLQPLEGVVFEISIKDGKSLGQFATNADGQIVLKDADPNQIYLVKEVQALPGYLADDTVHEFTLQEAENGVIKLQNTPEHPIIISKKDAITGEPIPDTVFIVTHSDGRLVGEYRTGSNGMATVTGKDVVPGWYLVKEVKANPAYIASSETKLVELKLSAPAIVEFTNKPRTGLQIRKVDDVTGDPLEGVQFKVTELSGAVIGTFTTDADGVINITDREEGWVQVTEVKGLDGYKPDPAPRNIELVSGKLSVLEYRNQPYPVLKIVKLDAVTRQPLEGVKVKVFDNQHREIGVYTTNKLGQILLSGMDGGETLYVQEVEALPGYELDETVYEVTLAWGQTSTIEILNKEKATLRIKKVDAESKEPIYGVTFNMYDAKNNLLGEYTTDQEGIIEFSKELSAGKYKLKEIKADGYVVDSTIRTIEVKSGETTEIVIENQPMRGRIQIVKKAADDNPITKDKAGALLAGATFEVYDEDLNVVDTITTDAKGIATTKDLPMGTYGIKEIEAPEYYLLDGKVFYATLKVHNDLVRFEVLNTSEDVSVSIEKRGNQEVLAGDIMSYDFSNIRNDSNVVLDEFYFHDKLPADAVRLSKIVTGTWSERLTYSVEYCTNKKDSYRTLASNLSSKTSHTLDCSGEALNLAAGEYITDIRFVFGTVQPGFHEETKPVFYVNTLADLASGYRIINRADVGGRTGDEWIISKDTWVTVVWSKPKGNLPKTGI